MTTAGPLRVLVVDPSELFRIGFRSALAGDSGIQVVGEAADGGAALELTGRLTPDVVVMETRLGGSSGADLTRALLRDHPEVKVLVLTSSDDESTLRASVHAGATGYVLKDLPAAELAATLRAAATGRPTVTPSLAPKLMTELATAVRSPTTHDGSGVRLTERELEVLRHVARGLSNRAVGEALFLSENTVKNHVRSILEKLGVHTRMEAVLEASRAGLLKL